MTHQELKNFIVSRMSVSHIYQPAILLTLLENGGEASVQTIAKRCAELRGDTAESYQSKLLKYPKEALTKHGVINTSGRTEFKLTTDLKQLSDQARQELIAICRERLNKVK